MRQGLVSENIEKLIPYPPGKPIEELEREWGIRDSVKLASNENPLGPSPKAIEAISRNILKINRYPDGSGFYLKKRLSEKLGVKEENLILGNGSNELIELLIRTFLCPGGEVISADPAFVVYRKVVQSAGGKNIIVSLKNFIHDLKAITEKITSSTRIIFINNPNNPTGTIVKKRDFEEFLENLPDYVMVIMDEAYFEYVSDDEFPNSLNYQNSGRMIVTLRTFSKIYGLAGLRIGYGVARPDIIDYLNKVRQPFNVNSLAQVGALAALDDETHLEKSLELNRKELKRLYQELENMGIEYVPTQANFFLINLRRDCQEVYNALLKEGVITRAMAAYGLNEYIRLTVGLPLENDKFIKALKKII
jgi:histidinol-phosphate aminotransferase